MADEDSIRSKWEAAVKHVLDKAASDTAGAASRGQVRPRVSRHNPARYDD